MTKRKPMADRIREEGLHNTLNRHIDRDLFTATVSSAVTMDCGWAVLGFSGHQLITDLARSALVEAVMDIPELDLRAGQTHTWMESSLPQCLAELKLPDGDRIRALGCLWAEYHVKEPGVIPDLVADLITYPDCLSKPGWAKAVTICSASVFVDIGTQVPVGMIGGCTYGLNADGKMVAFLENTSGAYRLALPFLMALAAEHEGKAQTARAHIGGKA